MKKFLQKILGDKAGAAAAEYALILALVGGVIIAAMTALGGNIQTKVQGVADAISSAPNP